MDREAQAAVVQVLLSAAGEPGTAFEVKVFGASVSIKFEPDGHNLAVVELSWNFLTFNEIDRFPHDVLAMVPGMADIELWAYLPPRRDEDSPHTWYAYVPRVWVDDLATSLELDHLLDSAGQWTPMNPTMDGSETFSHYASGKVVTLAYVSGIEITGLCGASGFVASILTRG